jgi:RNA polymerase sigma factor (sigma-70 family)
MTAVDRSLPGQDWSGETRLELTDIPDAGAEDRALLQRLRAGEDSAFGELFARHSAAVRRLAFGLVNDRSEAEDLTAEAFFRVLQAIRRGSGPNDNVRGYLLIVARRVAWEWRTRRRDVPVSDEELTHRAGANPDTSGQSTERNLITRAFTSLPERWRSVLWKVEVEGERPAVVANNFGLSPNATAALARRARQGLRAAYLQAHLAADRSGAGCRSVLEKLGAYTAGSIKGSERRRIRAHLVGCPSCTTMHAELREVCSGLRAHAAMVTGVAVAGGFGTAVKGMLASAKAQVALIASSATVIGALGVVAGPWGAGDGNAVAFDDLDGKRGVELEITGTQPSEETPESIAVTTGTLSTSAVVPRRSTTPRANTPQAQDAPVIYRETNVLRRAEGRGDYMVVYETTSVTEVDSADQTNTYVHTTEFTETNSTLGITESGGPRTDQPTPSESVKPSTTTTKPTSSTPTTTTTPKSSPPPQPEGRVGS